MTLLSKSHDPACRFYAVSDLGTKALRSAGQFIRVGSGPKVRRPKPWNPKSNSSDASIVVVQALKS